MKNNIFFPADILLPDCQKVNYEKFSVIACDQYTSEPEYWENVKKSADEKYSAYNIILPEVYLSSDVDAYTKRITANMQDYLKNLFFTYGNHMIYVERTLPSNGKIRRGIVGMIDLEAYDYNKGSTSAIRATEGTVLERIPPRVKIRQDAVLESPHVMLFCDDPEKTVIEPIADKKDTLEKAYDFDLMCGGGNIKGYFLSSKEIKRIDDAICNLADIDKFNAKYGTNEENALVFAVGDGNHSLATAKACYENLKNKIGDEAKNSLARYALVELVNIHDESIEFEPIYRIIMNVEPIKVINELEKFCQITFEKPDCKYYKYDFYTEEESGEIYIKNPSSALPVGELQNFLFEFAKKYPECEIDYIHGVENLKTLAKEEYCIGFIFDGMRKDELFSSVIKDGALPRKTFSMGHADDKRFYLECRKIAD